MPELFNVHGFEPPDPVTGRSLCSRVDHGVSGLLPTTWAPVSDSLSLRLRQFPGLALPPTITRRSIMQKVRRHPLRPLLGAIGLRPLVSAGFQVLLTRLVAVLFIVQSPYLSTIGHRGVFSLGRWADPLRTEFHELRATLESTC